MTQQFDVQAVKTWLQLRDGSQDAILANLVEVVTARINDLPHAPRNADGTWSARTVHAAIMLAGRLYRRRNSPGGVEALAEGGATYVSRWDPDVAQLLRIGSYAPPRVG